MKLLTTIQPRADGTVIVSGLSKTPKGETVEHVFTEDDHGDLVCDVGHEPTVKHLLKTGNFEPYDQDDYEAARALVRSEPVVAAGDAPSDDDTDIDDEDRLPDDDPVDMNAAPVEASNAPPAPPAAAEAPAAAAPAPTADKPKGKGKAAAEAPAAA